MPEPVPAELESQSVPPTRSVLALVAILIAITAPYVAASHAIDTDLSTDWSRIEVLFLVAGWLLLLAVFLPAATMALFQATSRRSFALGTAAVLIAIVGSHAFVLRAPWPAPPMIALAYPVAGLLAALTVAGAEARRGAYSSAPSQSSSEHSSRPDRT